MALKTAAVIVNWNGAQFLEPLLRSLQGANLSETVVVDNASSDPSAEILKRHPGVRVIQNEKNIGFAAAANQGIAATNTPYVLLLNVDVQTLPGSIDVLELFLDSNSRAAVVAPQLLFPDRRLQPSCRSFPTILGLFLYLSYLDRIFPSSYRLKEEEHDAIAEVDQPMGAALLLRRSALDEVGMFDRDFFLYMEEVDLCDRIKKRGWKIFYLPQSQIIHSTGGSSAQDWEHSQMYFFQSVLLYFRKRSPRWKIHLLKSALAVALILRSSVLFVCGRIRQSRFYLGMSVTIFSL